MIGVMVRMVRVMVRVIAEVIKIKDENAEMVGAAVVIGL